MYSTVYLCQWHQVAGTRAISLVPCFTGKIGSVCIQFRPAGASGSRHTSSGDWYSVGTKYRPDFCFRVLLCSTLACSHGVFLVRVCSRRQALKSHSVTSLRGGALVSHQVLSRHLPPFPPALMLAIEKYVASIRSDDLHLYGACSCKQLLPCPASTNSPGRLRPGRALRPPSRSLLCLLESTLDVPTWSLEVRPSVSVG
jgi:hypothetical protein